MKLIDKKEVRVVQISDATAEDGRRKTERCRAHSRLTDKNDSACELYYEMKERWGE